MTCVSDDLLEECCVSMLYGNMDIYRLMSHAQKVEDPRLRKRNKDAKRARPYDGCAYKGKLEIQDNLRFKKRFSNKIPFNVLRNNKERVPNPKPQGGKCHGSQS